jgi:anti-sigma regulatory factor (Ser/Thr protein kinase)
MTTRTQLRRAGAEMIGDDALLVLSELVTNAVLHSGCGPEENIGVQVSTDGERVWISVRDPGLSGGEARPHARDPRRVGGLGLVVVDTLATRWGSDRLDGYHVWAELPATRAEAGQLCSTA